MGRRNPALLRIARVEFKPLPQMELHARLFRAFDLLDMKRDILRPLPAGEQALICTNKEDSGTATSQT